MLQAGKRLVLALAGTQVKLPAILEAPLLVLMGPTTEAQTITEWVDKTNNGLCGTWKVLGGKK